MVDGRAQHRPRVDRGDGCVGAQCQRHPGGGGGGERVEGEGTLGSEALRVQAVGPTPQGVERGLDAGDHTPLREPRRVVTGQHLGVFESVPGLRDRGTAQFVGDDGERVDRGPDGGVADDVESGLDSGDGAGAHVCGDLVDSQVALAGPAGQIGIGFAEPRRVGAEGSVDEQVAAQRVGAGGVQQLPGLVGVSDRLTPVAADLDTV